MTKRSKSVASVAAVVGALTMSSSVLAQRAAPTPTQTSKPSGQRPTQRLVPSEAPPAPLPSQTAGPGQSRRAALPQGFSVVLVLGDLQGASTADDVPPAARKALVDMRDFLPFKSYKLLDAAWLMCCSTGGHGSASQVLRGPDDVEYELSLETARFEGSRVSVRFSLRSNSSVTIADAPDAASASAMRTVQRRLANLSDQREFLDKQIGEARGKVEVGMAPASEVAKLELERRRLEREILDHEATVHAADSRAAVANTRGARGVARTTPERPSRSAIIDTNFTMDVGETVVVGTSRLKGGSRALIALLTAVPPRAPTERRE